MSNRPKLSGQDILRPKLTELDRKVLQVEAAWEAQPTRAEQNAELTRLRTEEEIAWYEALPSYPLR